ncbi:hypothetical protein EVAR_19753_1 [Eumeta japonica]|uniref:Uncharacterized protein n=1 Tax=Eumeta variegata TaxID=151549 RepID=A0A4C1URW3_EUMVA|nr:hypothetical protein EVAR_19753_1 [Eumeta japonica]
MIKQQDKSASSVSDCGNKGGGCSPLGGATSGVGPDRVMISTFRQDGTAGAAPPPDDASDRHSRSAIITTSRICPSVGPSRQLMSPFSRRPNRLVMRVDPLRDCGAGTGAYSHVRNDGFGIIKNIDCVLAGASQAAGGRRGGVGRVANYRVLTQPNRRQHNGAIPIRPFADIVDDLGRIMSTQNDRVRVVVTSKSRQQMALAAVKLLSPRRRSDVTEIQARSL